MFFAVIVNGKNNVLASRELVRLRPAVFSPNFRIGQLNAVTISIGQQMPHLPLGFVTILRLNFKLELHFIHSLPVDAGGKIDELSPSVDRSSDFLLAVECDPSKSSASLAIRTRLRFGLGRRRARSS